MSSKIRHPRAFIVRPTPPIRDYISPQPSHLLDICLSPYLSTTAPSEISWDPSPLPPGHHLVYFPTQATESGLQPDGTEAQIDPPPPKPFPRVWFGGAIKFGALPLMTYSHAIMRERFETTEQRNKVMNAWFVREISAADGSVRIVERRCLAFFTETAAAGESSVARKDGIPRGGSRQPLKADFSREFIPTPLLLFRFSALTYNAHRIHYDAEYARSESYRQAVCQGPLALVLLLGLLREEAPKARITSFEYRNIAPMFVGERYRICGRRSGAGKVNLWATTPEDRLSVKGTAMIDDGG